MSDNKRIHWTVVSKGTKTDYVFCRCVCGTEREVRHSAIKSGMSKSCGCKKAGLVSAARKTHGRSRTPIHNIWWAMCQRCYDKSVESYPNYGGRGVKVAERWRGETGFQNFLADMGERPSSKHSIDRIDHNGDYEPGNCRWATAAVQSRGRRSNVNITYGGRTQCLKDWAAELGVDSNTIRYRIRKWGLERAMTEPINEKRITRRNHA